MRRRFRVALGRLAPTSSGVTTVHRGSRSNSTADAEIFSAITTLMNVFSRRF